MPIALVALGTVPVIAGSLRLVELSGGAATMPSNPRYAASPYPSWVHIVSATVFATLGAFQFSPRLRGRRPGWHRNAGRVLVAAGLGVALSALWLNQFFPKPDAAREVLYPLRLVFGVAMVVSILLGFAAALRSDLASHRARTTDWNREGLLGRSSRARPPVRRQPAEAPDSTEHRTSEMTSRTATP